MPEYKLILGKIHDRHRVFAENVADAVTYYGFPQEVQICAFLRGHGISDFLKVVAYDSGEPIFEGEGDANSYIRKYDRVTLLPLAQEAEPDMSSELQQLTNRQWRETTSKILSKHSSRLSRLEEANGIALATKPADYSSTFGMIEDRLEKLEDVAHTPVNSKPLFGAIEARLTEIEKAEDAVHWVNKRVDGLHNRLAEIENARAAAELAEAAQTGVAAPLPESEVGGWIVFDPHAGSHSLYLGSGYRLFGNVEEAQRFINTHQHLTSASIFPVGPAISQVTKGYIVIDKDGDVRPGCVPPFSTVDGIDGARSFCAKNGDKPHRIFRIAEQVWPEKEKKP